MYKVKFKKTIIIIIIKKIKNKKVKEIEKASQAPSP